MSSKTITQNDLTNILNEIFPATSDDMTPAQIEDFVQSLNAVATSSVDYIVEQGISGRWTYRKWNSGIAECWGYYSKSIAAGATDNENYITYPFTFTATPNITIGLYAGGADLYRAHVTNAAGTDNTQVRLTMTNKHTAAVTFGVWINLFGRWK